MDLVFSLLISGDEKGSFIQFITLMETALKYKIKFPWLVIGLSDRILLKNWIDLNILNDIVSICFYLCIICKLKRKSQNWEEK